MDSIDIYRAADLFVTIKPDNNSVQSKKVMGDNLLNIVFEENHYIKFAINDYCNVFGELYSLSQLPIVTKVSRFRYRYTLVMNAEGYDLAKINCLFLGSNNTLRESEFSLMGNADTFIDLIISNANRAGSGWIKGQVIPTVYKNLSFSKENCYNVLGRLAEEFETEFAIEGKTIHLTKRVTDTGFTYKHGRNKGLYEITRNILNNSNVFTRLYAYGSDKNLPPDYNGGALRLQMRSSVATPVIEPLLIHDVIGFVSIVGDGTQNITFQFTPGTDSSIAALSIEVRPVGSSGEWQAYTGSPASPRVINVLVGDYNVRFRSQNSGAVTQQITVTGTFTTPLLPGTAKQPIFYIEKNVALYGVIETTEFFDNIFPHRTGTVTAIDATNFYKFTDVLIDFNVNEQLLPGIPAKITFNTGQLAGYTFGISSFNNSTKQFVILKNQDEKTLDVPSASLKPAIGDEYVITDITLPQSYIDVAEADLKAAAQALLDQISEPQLTYTMTFDPVFLKRFNRTLNIGDLVWLIDVELEVQKKIRIVSTTRNIVNEFQFTAELSDTVSPSNIALILSAQANTDNAVNGIQQSLVNNSILNNRIIGDLKVEQGTIELDDILTTATTTGFSQIYIEDATGKLHKKI